MKKKPLFQILFLIAVISLLGAQEQNWRLCTKVIDGDTIVLDGDERVRLIGVDTPETKDPRKPVQRFGEEAYLFTKSLVDGQYVRLEYDQERVDKYGRTLAYVYLQDGTLVNAEIIKKGFGFAYTKYPFKYLEEFRKYEQEARETWKGLWYGGTEKPVEAEEREEAITPTQADENTIVYITKTGTKYHSANCRYLSKSKIPITLKEAVERGYGPCSVCGPPILKTTSAKPKTKDTTADITVYVTRTGSKYHRGSCSYLRKSRIPMSLKEACAAGYGPCSRCNPPKCK
jgi:micrococcal nuclease